MALLVRMAGPEVLVVLQLCASHRLLEHRQPVEDGRILCLRLAQAFDSGIAARRHALVPLSALGRIL